MEVSIKSHNEESKRRLSDWGSKMRGPDEKFRWGIKKGAS